MENWFEESLTNLHNEQHHIINELLALLRMKKSLFKKKQEEKKTKPEMSRLQSDNTMRTMALDVAQRSRLQHQMQQHVQLLTQIHLLASANPILSLEATTTKTFLRELSTFAQSSVVLHHQFSAKFQTMFQPCNLKGAMQLIEDFHSHIHIDLSPQKNVKKSDSDCPCLPKQVAWILATSRVFMYPELLPIRSLKGKNPREKVFFTRAEDNLLALGLKHFEGTEFPKPLISKYLLTAKSAHQLTVRIKNLTISRAPDNIIKYYKKTKQLPILFKCCEELQPDQWKPPVEREEQHLPFWLKASLPSIQEEIQHLANHTQELENKSGLSETGSEPHVESGNDTQYPLLLPKGVVLTLKPLAKFSSGKIWRRRSSVPKPLLIRPAPFLQPCSQDNISVTLAQLEALPSKSEIPNSQLIQPAPVLQPVPEISPLGITRSNGFKVPIALPAVVPENGTCPAPAMSQAFLSPVPATFQSKVLFPSFVAPNLHKPGIKPPKRKWAKATHLLKPTPVLPSPPVILTVPATTMEVVGLNSSCNVVQPLTAVAQSPQTIPITTLLVSPTSFICPLNPPLIASSIPPLIVPGNPVNLLVPTNPEENTQVKPNIPCPQVEGDTAFPAMEPKLEPQELSPLCPSPYPKEEHSPGPPPPGRESQVDVFEGNAYSWTVVKTLDGRQVLEPLPHTSQKVINFLERNLVNTVKVDPGEEANMTWSRCSEPNICDEIKKEVFMELDGGPLDEEAGSTQEVVKVAALQKEEEGETALMFSAPQVTQGEGNPGGKTSKESSKNASSSTNSDTTLSSPLGKPEEEEKEYAEDLHQDEEMTFASEESVVFVPELQETVEKLTWLVSTRYMGCESGSEEEKPQKGNFEDMVEVEGMESLRKDVQMADEVDRDPSFYLCFT